MITQTENKKSQKNDGIPMLFDFELDYPILMPSYVKTYNRDFTQDYKTMYYRDFLYLVNNVDAPFKDVLQARYLRLTERKTKENADIWKYGDKTLLPIHHEYLAKKREQQLQNEYNNIMSGLEESFNRENYVPVKRLSGSEFKKRLNGI